MPKDWCFWTVVLEKTLESPLDCKEIQPVHTKGAKSWVFTGRTDVEAETPMLWQADVKSWLTGKDPDTGKDWSREEKGITKDEMVGWPHPLNGHEFGQTLGVGDGQGGLACCSPWGHKDLDMTEWLNWTEYHIWPWFSLFSAQFLLPYFCSTWKNNLFLSEILCFPDNGTRKTITPRNPMNIGFLRLVIMNCLHSLVSSAIAM